MNRFFALGRISFSLLLVTPSALAAAEGDLAPDAVALLKRSIAAHADGPAKVRLEFRGTTITPDQSKFPDSRFGPAKPHPWTVSVALDEKADTLVVGLKSAIDGDFNFPLSFVYANGRGFTVRLTGEHEPLTARPPFANSYLPHLLLADVLRTARSAKLAADSTFDRIDYVSASGAADSLLFDRRTHLLTAIVRGKQATVYGDQLRKTSYGGYRRVGGTTVPTSLTVRTSSPVLGTYVRSLKLIGSEHAGPTHVELTLPASAPPYRPDSTSFEVQPMGRDVYLLRNVAREGLLSYNVLAVVFDDHVMMVEAALNDATSRRAIEAVATIAPGKPIRTLVQTHHHNDHIAGIRTYIANGATIIAPTGMRPLVERITTTHSVIAPDALARSPVSPRIEEVGRERVIKDARNEVRLYDVPTEHSAHMLVVYLPEQKLLYQGDLISADEIALNDTSRRFLAWLKEVGLPVTALAGLHGRTVKGSELDLLIRDGRLLASSAVNEATGR